jgi:hypothetical protein
MPSMIQRVIPVEIGAFGRSTQVILSALEANEASRPVSIDISDEVGAKGDPRWTLRVHMTGEHWSPRATGPVPSRRLHRYPHQYGGYLDAWEQMEPGGVLASDDVDWSVAFIHLVAAFGV